MGSGRVARSRALGSAVLAGAALVLGCGSGSSPVAPSPGGDGGIDAGAVDAGENDVSADQGTAPTTCTGALHWLGDFDGDGSDDCAVGAGSDISFYPGLAAGGFSATAVKSMGVLPAAVTMGGKSFVNIVDMDGDGRQDLVLTVTGFAYLIHGHADGTLTWSLKDTAGFSFSWLLQGAPTAGDFTGDGKTDLFLALIQPTAGNDAVTWSVLTAQGGTLGWIHTTAGFFSGAAGGYVMATSGDVDGDGDRDGIAIIRVQDASGVGPGPVVVIATNNGDGTFVAAAADSTMPAAPTTMVTGTDGARDVSTGDDNNDGHLDLRVTLPAGVQTFYGDGHGHFGIAAP